MDRRGDQRSIISAAMVVLSLIVVGWPYYGCATYLIGESPRFAEVAVIAFVILVSATGLQLSLRSSWPGLLPAGGRTRAGAWVALYLAAGIPLAAFFAAAWLDHGTTAGGVLLVFATGAVFSGFGIYGAIHWLFGQGTIVVSQEVTLGSFLAGLPGLPGARDKKPSTQWLHSAGSYLFFVGDTKRVERAWFPAAEAKPVEDLDVYSYNDVHYALFTELEVESRMQGIELSPGDQKLFDDFLTAVLALDHAVEHGLNADGRELLMAPEWHSFSAAARQIFERAAVFGRVKERIRRQRPQR